jgi:hypothetical protein
MIYSKELIGHLSYLMSNTLRYDVVFQTALKKYQFQISNSYWFIPIPGTDRSEHIAMFFYYYGSLKELSSFYNTGNPECKYPSLFNVAPTLIQRGIDGDIYNFKFLFTCIVDKAWNTEIIENLVVKPIFSRMESAMRKALDDSPFIVGWNPNYKIIFDSTDNVGGSIHQSYFGDFVSVAIIDNLEIIVNNDYCEKEYKKLTEDYQNYLLKALGRDIG